MQKKNVPVDLSRVILWKGVVKQESIIKSGHPIRVQNKMGCSRKKVASAV